MDKKFKLQKILEYRQRVFDLEKQKLSDLTNRLKELKYKREALLIETENKKRELDNFKLENNFIMINMSIKYIEKLQQQLIEISNNIDKLKREIEEQKKKVVSAMNDVKIMERLKEKHVANFLTYLRKEEIKMLDELVITRSGNNEV